MAVVNTYVYTSDKDGKSVVLAPGQEVPKGVTVTNPDVFGELPEADLSAAPAIDMPVATPAVEAPSSDGLDNMSHAELDAEADKDGIDLSSLGHKPSRDDKIAAIRSARGTQS